MPPKGKQVQQSVKLVEDKFFGVRNKNKSKKVQNDMENAKKVAINNTFKSAAEREAYEIKQQAKAEEKKREKKEQEDWLLGGGGATLKALLKKKQEEEAAARKLAEEEEAKIDPKTIICEEFMQGRCPRGDQCKFLHDDANSRKSAKINIYADPRGEDVHKRENSTDIVCKWFLEAVESSHYGHFWVCKNGDACIYRHCIPIGFVLNLKKGKSAEDSQVEVMDISEAIEIERKKLDISNCTPVNPETFAAWKLKREEKRIEEEKQVALELQKKQTKGTNVGLTGRMLFSYDPSLFFDDEAAANDDELQFESDNEDEDDEKEENNYGDDGNAENDQVEEAEQPEEQPEE